MNNEADYPGKGIVLFLTTFILIAVFVSGIPADPASGGDAVIPPFGWVQVPKLVCDTCTENPMALLYNYSNISVTRQYPTFLRKKVADCDKKQVTGRDPGIFLSSQ
ncbi:hypothetical protein Mhun_2776 [Methanospirillum hungatei JF-1]|uniref:Uncharacterized protein n=1 Tax=Methanospirillum hungatei JF-1 (strain ATCC 27890 / DSM 864 / NBRC 100397 / JF-1) TaxID=323259 RepID=Q2FTT2_METHJ|nr:hypothetical protein [Methanospirillum hungatei]ABD42471.1 hypothetical protein Mhun_2776 [Methanospirillum hungatei JF-1]